MLNTNHGNPRLMSKLGGGDAEKTPAAKKKPRGKAKAKGKAVKAA